MHEGVPFSCKTRPVLFHCFGFSLGLGNIQSNKCLGDNVGLLVDIRFLAWTFKLMKYGSLHSSFLIILLGCDPEPCCIEASKIFPILSLTIRYCPHDHTQGQIDDLDMPCVSAPCY
jgi:hypothetical protein